ncbi:hypothetical protein [Olsenella sp. Marseille-P4559]|uniref:hypothetical protein n=1 Tax=Olsenella sp. Marseille-P4559 TaxID=2364795 RepID=UPI001A9282B0|nr:hypothetical protein [Olsenella sp. Marseille-P4559]
MYHTVAHDDFHLDLRCEVISLGGFHLFVFPSEFGGDFGIRMREECPVQGLVFGYTNGYHEYFLPSWEYGLSFETAHTEVPKGELSASATSSCRPPSFWVASRVAPSHSGCNNGINQGKYRIAVE